MSAPNWEEELRDELDCRICREPFKDPVILKCGHNYCRVCITQCWEVLGTGYCPQCRKSLPKGELRPNKPLEEAVDIARDLEGECKKHEEVFSLFCKEDRTLICMVCRESREHRDHTVVPIAEAAEDYKEQILSHLSQRVREERGRQVAAEEGRYQTLLEQLLRHRNHFQCVREERGRRVAAKHGKYETLVKKTEHLKQESVTEFKQVHQILKQKEQLLQNCLEGPKQDLVNTRNKNTNRCSRGLLPLSSLLAEIKQKCQQPDIEFFKDIDSTLSRCQQVKSEEETPVDSLTELESRVQALSESQKVLRDLLKKFRVELAPELGPLENISSEVKRRICCEDPTEEVPDDPEQDDTSDCLLDCGGETRFLDIPDSALDVLNSEQDGSQNQQRGSPEISEEDLPSVIPHEESSELLLEEIMRVLRDPFPTAPVLQTFPQRVRCSHDSGGPPAALPAYVSPKPRVQQTLRRARLREVHQSRGTSRPSAGTLPERGQEISRVGNEMFIDGHRILGLEGTSGGQISPPDFEQPCTPKSLITESQPPLKRAKISTSAASLECRCDPRDREIKCVPPPAPPPPSGILHSLTYPEPPALTPAPCPPHPAPCTSPHTSSPDSCTPTPPQP